MMLARGSHFEGDVIGSIMSWPPFGCCTEHVCGLVERNFDPRWEIRRMRVLWLSFQFLRRSTSRLGYNAMPTGHVDFR